MKKDTEEKQVKNDIMLTEDLLRYIKIKSTNIGLVCVIIIVVIGIYGFFVFNKMSVNNDFLNNIGKFNEIQSQNKSMEATLFINNSYISKLLTNLGKMEDALENSHTSMITKFDNKMVVIHKKLNENKKNYRKLRYEADVRGFNENNGYYHDFMSVDNDLKEKIKGGWLSDNLVKEIDRFDDSFSNYTQQIEKGKNVENLVDDIENDYYEIQNRVLKSIKGKEYEAEVKEYDAKKRDAFDKMIQCDRGIVEIEKSCRENSELIGEYADSIEETCSEDSRVEAQGMTLVFVVLIATACIFAVIFNQSLARQLIASIKRYDAQMVNKKVSESKSGFLSNMSHEFRTHMNAMIGMNEMVIRDTREERIKRYAYKVKRGGEALLDLFQDVLDDSMLESGNIIIEQAEYDIVDIVKEVYSLTNPIAENKGLVLNVVNDFDLPRKYIGDARRMKQVIYKLILNGLEYTEKGNVTLSINHNISGEDAELIIRVSDTGMGIKEQDINKTKASFDSVKNEYDRSIEGNGLAMDIVHRLLELMNSKLEMDTEYGKGTSFYFHIEQAVVSMEKTGNLREELENTIETKVESNRTRFRAPKSSILVVDDTEMNLIIVKGLLKPTMINIDTAKSGLEAIEMVKSKTYDLFFIDHRMPVMDGIETYEKLKDLESIKGESTPSIVLTANVEDGAEEYYKKVGFDEYLAKPIEVDKLEEVLLKFLPEKDIQYIDKGKLVEEPEKEESMVSDNSNVSAMNLINSYNSSSVGEATVEAEAKKDDDDPNLQGIDYEEAIKNCVNKEIWLSAVGDFVLSAKKKPDEIQSYLDNEDIKNYTIQVHGLKSSARLVGAMELSKQAADLEFLGNANDIDSIRLLTANLLFLYKKTGDIFREYIGEDEETDEADDRDLISEDELNEAYGGIREAAECFDFDTAYEILQMLGDYKLPDSEKEKYDIIKEKISEVDRDGILDLLQ